MENSIVDQVIILTKSEMIRKRNLVTATTNIRYNQAMSKTFSAGLRSMKMLTMMKI